MTAPLESDQMSLSPKPDLINGYYSLATNNRLTIHKEFINKLIYTFRDYYLFKFRVKEHLVKFIHTLKRTNSEIVCRICLSNESEENLTSWCNCSGTMGLMHKSCLERWLLESNSNECEICKFNYEFKFEKVIPTFKQWLCRPDSFSENSHRLLKDLFWFFIMTPLTCFNPNWILFAVNLISLLIHFNYHYTMFRDWQKKNQHVTIKMNIEDHERNSFKQKSIEDTASKNFI